MGQPVRRAYVTALSVILLIPCFWQRRIQAGDLASHIYNAWLAQQIELGKAPALTIAPVSTNVLFDLILSWLYRSFGADAAQRIAVSLVVLIFFWGAFGFISASSNAPPWFLVPSLAMLTYGWVFHMGFFNFYLAAGLSLWALALNLKGRVVPNVAAAGLLLLAYPAHPIPPLWAACVIAYRLIAQRLAWRARLIAFGSAIACLGYLLRAKYATYSSASQALESTALDQVWIFGPKYFGITIGLGVLWGFVLLGMSHAKPVRGLIHDVSFQLCLLMGFGIFIFPTSIQLPQYRMGLTFITERAALLQGVLICAVLATAKPPKWLAASFIVLAFVYFAFLYRDTDTLNNIERRMETLTAGLSLNDRVFSSLQNPKSRVGFLDHNLDRVCLGRCLSYGNYEPVSGAFRIRVTGPNPEVVASGADYAGLRDGGYVVKEADLPLYQIVPCAEKPSPELCLKRLEAGEATKQYPVSIGRPF